MKEHSEPSKEETKITINKIMAIKDQLGEPRISQIKVIENAVLPDDCIVVSSYIFKQLKSNLKDGK